MKNIALILFSITIAIAVVATLPFSFSSKKKQSLLSKNGKTINFV